VESRYAGQGANYHGSGRCTFTVWAPFLNRVDLKIVSPAERLCPMERDSAGYWKAELNNISPGTRYLYRLDDEQDRPDPASRSQPDGVHGPSEVIDPCGFSWTDAAWKGVALRDYIIYELHTGVFTREGTFEAIIPYLDYLKELGVTALEIMPVAQFPGSRNWGYDGVYPCAVQNSYGGPDGLKALVDACHGKGLAVILDVVYNHLGPEGNYLWAYGPYFTDRYRTPWGQAVNFDGPYSDEVRRYFTDNALFWITEYHFDALRLDAVHGIYDFSARHILRDLSDAAGRQAEALGRRIYVIAESDLNDARVIASAGSGGYGLDAQWNDDFHHCLHTLLTGEKSGYYEDFGAMRQIEKAFREGFVYSGEYSGYRKRKHGSPSGGLPAHRFIVFSQNHDQVGNRAGGDRPGRTQSLEKLRLAAGVVLLSPFIPLLFMGEEYGETAPFQYFVSHSDKDLIKAVRKGRRDEFSSFGWAGEVPDPQAEGTFLNSKLDTGLHLQGAHAALFGFYRELIRLRKEVPALSDPSRDSMEAGCFEKDKVLYVRRRAEADEVICIYNFNSEDAHAGLMVPEGSWTRVLDSSMKDWGGDGALSADRIESQGAEIRLKVKNHAFVLYRRDNSGL